MAQAHIGGILVAVLVEVDVTLLSNCRTEITDISLAPNERGSRPLYVELPEPIRGPTESEPAALIREWSPKTSTPQILGERAPAFVKKADLRDAAARKAVN
jgi:hypothetical protein